MADEIKEWVERLPPSVASLRDLALRHLSAGCVADPKSGALLIDHRPNVAPEAYGIVFFPGIGDSDMNRYCATQGRNGRQIEVPNDYRLILSYLNGAEILQGRFFGIPRSMLGDPPLLDRSTRQPLDIGSANTNWQLKYKAESRFFFGYGPHSDTENLGYFCDRDSRIETFLPGGVRVGNYSGFEEFLNIEIARLESIYPEYERRQEKFRREISAKQKAPRTRISNH